MECSGLFIYLVIYFPGALKYTVIVFYESWLRIATKINLFTNKVVSTELKLFLFHVRKFNGTLHTKRTALADSLLFSVTLFKKAQILRF